MDDVTELALNGMGSLLGLGRDIVFPVTDDRLRGFPELCSRASNRFEDEICDDMECGYKRQAEGSFTPQWW